ncbi:hypothetical protein N657DRAFT_364854 [Parathielavia appendiculata]|uniref:Uncharacterized protein n=1 Tax=Parathielavia appendiculata TaxID=2587402 RepID=A0AAN6U593_9PEZI|nr:hypothetical protein N657DRAFT_364854 [Parathielavia appendiculata]
MESTKQGLEKGKNEQRPCKCLTTQTKISRCLDPCSPPPQPPPPAPWKLRSRNKDFAPKTSVARHAQPREEEKPFARTPPSVFNSHASSCAALMR